MTTSRRDFLKTAGVAAGALSVSSLPSWITSVTAAEEAAANGVDKNALADVALNTARKLGVTYADIRINRYRNESIATREQQVQNVSRGQNFGFGVRVLYKGTWGFASSRSVTPEDVRASRNKRSKSRAQTQSTSGNASRWFRSKGRDQLEKLV